MKIKTKINADETVTRGAGGTVSLQLYREMV